MYVRLSGIGGDQRHGSSGRLGSHCLEMREINTPHRDTTRLIWDPSISKGKDGKSWKPSRRDSGTSGVASVHFRDLKVL